MNTLRHNKKRAGVILLDTYIIENNLPLNDSDVMTQYNKLLVNLDNAINGREASEGSASWGEIIVDLIKLIIMILELVYNLVVYIKAN